MDPSKAVDFIRMHLPVSIVVAIATALPVWNIAHSLYNERITALDHKVKELGVTVRTLEDKVAVLDQAAKRKLEASGATFTAEELLAHSLATEAAEEEP